MDDLGCAVNHALSCHGFRFLLIFFRSLLAYQNDCNVAPHTVDSDIFYLVINLSASSSSQKKKTAPDFDVLKDSYRSLDAQILQNE